MNKQPLKALAILAVLAGSLTVNAVYAAEVTDVLKAGAVKAKAAKSAQTKVDRIADQTDGLLQEFKQVNKQIESLRVYNSQLDRQITSQKTMMSELKESIENATIIERGISPLMLSMLAGLEDFIALDVPFKQAQRNAAIADLYVNMDSAKFSAAEKFRQILEVYDIESEYSLSLESYRDMIDIDADGSEVEVEVLRVGRVALMYQTKDKSQTGAWNKTTGSWETLGSGYRRAVDQGIRIAKKLSPQDVMQMPITAPETAQ
tara:strand:+ start:554 stop:1336 length:783 start_codon:yes stop_codon:yes gene_type:complete